MTGKYQGWTNRETWAAYLHTTADCDMLHHCKDKSGLEIRAVWDAQADNLDVHIHGMGWSPIEALLDIGSMWRVNWDEIALALRDED